MSRAVTCFGSGDNRQACPFFSMRMYGMYRKSAFCTSSMPFGADRGKIRVEGGLGGVARVSCKSSSRSRQELEAEYYKEWERLTLIPEEELNRNMTVVSFLTFVPMWLRYNGIPGPLRYLLFSKASPLQRLWPFSDEASKSEGEN